MRGRMMMYLDQYGSKYWASSVKELRAHFGGKRADKMYRDVHDDETGHNVSGHVGYVISGHWLTAYIPYFHQQRPTKGKR